MSAKVDQHHLAVGRSGWKSGAVEQTVNGPAHHLYHRVDGLRIAEVAPVEVVERSVAILDVEAVDLGSQLGKDRRSGRSHTGCCAGDQSPRTVVTEDVVHVDSPCLVRVRSLRTG